MSQNSLRLNPPTEWFGEFNYNIHFFGLIDLITDLRKKFDIEQTLQMGSGFNKNSRFNRPYRKMIEVGSYKGESTMLFAASGLFDEIHCIDPHDGYEEANDMLSNSWDDVHSEFIRNTRPFGDMIIHHRDYSYNIVDRFGAQDFDFVYIDAAHDYESVKNDILNYKSKTNSLFGGHDYLTHPGVTAAVTDVFGAPAKHYQDGSWMIMKKRGKYYSL